MKGTASRVNFNNTNAHDRLTGILSVVQGIDGLTSFYGTFMNCDNLSGSIPAGIFDNATPVTNFEYTFWRCLGLTGSIPAGLFDNNTLVTTFDSTFMTCDGLTSIPVGLFDNNTEVTNFYQTFRWCGNLNSIPSGIFANNSKVTTFYGTFYGLTALTTNVPELWVDTTTKFPNLTEYTYCFSGTNNAANSGSIPAARK